MEIVEQVKSKLSREVQKVCTCQTLSTCLILLVFFLFMFPAFYMVVPSMIGGFYSEMFRNNFEVREDYMFPKMQEYQIFSGTLNQDTSMVVSLFLLCIFLL